MRRRCFAVVLFALGAASCVGAPLAPVLPSVADLPAAAGDLPCALTWLYILPDRHDYDEYSALTSDGTCLAYETSNHSEQGSSALSASAWLYNLRTGARSPLRRPNDHSLCAVGAWSPDEAYVSWNSWECWIDGLQGQVGVANRRGRCRPLLTSGQIGALLGLPPRGGGSLPLTIKAGAWSPDGRSLLWHSTGYEEHPEYDAVGAVTFGGEVPWVLSEARLARLLGVRKRVHLLWTDWSPVGTQVLVVFAVQPPPAARGRGAEGGWPGVLVVDRAGTPLRRRMLPDGLLTAGATSWSLNGTHLAVDRLDGSHSRQTLEIYDAATLQLRRTMGGRLERWVGPETLICREDTYTPRRDSKWSQWYTLDLRGGARQPLLETGPDPGDGASLLSPTLAAAQSYSTQPADAPRDAGRAVDLYLVDLVTWQRRLLQSAPGCYYNVAGSSDGSLLAWLPRGGPPHSQSGPLQVLEPTTGRKLTVQIDAALQPGPYYQWSRHGNHLLFSEGRAGRLLLLEFEAATERGS